MNATLLEQLQTELPVQLGTYSIAREGTGLAIVNPIKALCSVGAGPFAPAADDDRIDGLVERSDALARRFVEWRCPVLTLVDTTDAVVVPGGGGQGAAELAAELAWLGDDPDVTVLRKDCMDGFVGGIEPIYHGTHGTSRNRVVDWVNAHRLRAVLVTGVCTDMGVMDFVLTMLSARKHGLMATLEDIVVLEPATATYDAATHPRLPAHHMALYFMCARGALLAGELTGI